MKRLVKKSVSGFGLSYLFCDDWLIYAYDKNGKVYITCTEMWPEWLDISESEQSAENAVEKYMLPVAKKKWNNLSWQDTGETVWTLWDDLSEMETKFKQYNINLPIKKPE